MIKFAELPNGIFINLDKLISFGRSANVVGGYPVLFLLSTGAEIRFDFKTQSSFVTWIQENIP